MNNETILEQIEGVMDNQPAAKQIGMCLMMIARIAERARTDAHRGQIIMSVRLFLDSVIETMEGDPPKKH
jgi:hypothetical protein